MPFNPNAPQPGDALDANLVRNQLNGLKADYETQIAAIPAGPQGQKGDKGDTGDQGPPFAQAVIDGVTTLDPGQAATVSVNFDGTFVHFNFGIPHGEKGDQGDPGEVTSAQMNDAIAAAIADTARNPSAIGPYTGDFSDPPTQQEMRDYRDYQESLRQAMMR